MLLVNSNLSLQYEWQVQSSIQYIEVNVGNCFVALKFVQLKKHQKLGLSFFKAPVFLNAFLF